MSHPPKACCSRLRRGVCGFTLVEPLVVIAIIATLIALLPGSAGNKKLAAPPPGD